MFKFLGKWFQPLLAAGLLTFAVFHVVKAQQTPPKPPPPVEPSRTPFGKTVAGAGLVEAVNENVSLGAALPGIVEKVYVPVEKVGQVVKKGDALFLVDSRQLKAQLRYQTANLRVAQAQLARLKQQPRAEELPPKEAAVQVAMAQVALQQDLANRARKLLPSRAMSQEDVNQRVLQVEVSRKQLAQATRDYELLKAGAWKPDLDIAQVQVDLAEAMLEQTKTDMDRLLVRAPKDGVVLQVNVREGEYVGAQPSQALVVLGDTNKKVHVRVDVDEHDIPRFKTNRPAQASIRGTPQSKYPLKFLRVEPYVIPKKSLTGDNTERVDTRVLQVIYELDTVGRPIYVGQQLDVFIDVGDDDSVPSGSKAAPAVARE
jgi:multidrug efflux pump subunit AcrA (membrane-fusion protein)